MDEERLTNRVPGTARSDACIVMVCGRDEADQVRRQLADYDAGCLITYKRVEDLVLNAPSGKVALVILAARQDAATTKRTLKWLRHRWPDCSVAVVGDPDAADDERIARQGGAMYVARPVESDYISAVVSHVLGGKRAAKTWTI